MAWIRARYRRADKGFTLVELLCAMFLFAVVLTIISSATISMVHSLRKEQGQSDNLDASRKALELLDHQLRYASAVAVPGTNTAGTASYLEFQTGNTSAGTTTIPTQTCYQWRLNAATNFLEYRSWSFLLGQAPQNVTTATAWNTQVTGAATIGSTPVFAITQAVAAASATATPTASASASASAFAGVTRATVTVTFADVHGVPKTSTQNTVTLSAVNTTTTSTGVSVCAPTTINNGTTSGTWRP